MSTQKTDTAEIAATTDQAATTPMMMDEFVSKHPLNAELMLKLIYVCDSSVTQATVLWEVLRLMSLTKKDVFVGVSKYDMAKRYPNIASAFSFRSAFKALNECDLMYFQAGIPQTKAKYKAELSNLSLELEQLETMKSLAGLQIKGA